MAEQKHAHTHEVQFTDGKRYLGATLLNVLISISELVGGLLSGSLALISDSIHNFTDSLSIIVAGIAQKISGNKQNQRNTFGYWRAQIIAAFVNSVFLIIVTMMLIYESIQGFFDPHPIQGTVMLIVAVIGLLANLFTAFLLKPEGDNLNRKAAFLHIVADALSSVGVIFAAVMINLFNWVWVDPVITLLVALYMLKEAWPVLKQATQILMQSNVVLNLDEVRSFVQTYPQVKGCHHFHAWQVDEKRVMLSFHVTLQDMLLSDAELIIRDMQQNLAKKFDVHHVTIQPEVDHADMQMIADYDWNEEQ
ncbi:cation diffusion facilitator family transporter [Weissella soli]|uniref:Cobalt-zinc-cadmium efflux system protein n=4 Tax=Weissella soli TaxID=155866 RepID=A0A288Q5Z4_9LACO|nr:cation diffusion facilitator family transporter [Weissella soli]AOT56189.1 Cation efflux system protein CzcD [Weissella soli]MCT8394808.1 cation transporter [Weissella soli]NKY82648.1 cation transporter [Weissella soli]RDL11763.1 cobalt-zinc-cadmium efflux system protein [Weissella soli]GEN93010.1 cobalt transporter [Weissella soli]